MELNFNTQTACYQLSIFNNGIGVTHQALVRAFHFLDQAVASVAHGAKKAFAKSIFEFALKPT